MKTKTNSKLLRKYINHIDDKMYFWVLALALSVIKSVTFVKLLTLTEFVSFSVKWEDSIGQIPMDKPLKMYVSFYSCYCNKTPEEG